MTLAPILPAHDADSVALDFGVFVAEHARTYRTSQTAIIAALLPSIIPSQTFSPSQAPAASTSTTAPVDVKAEGDDASFSADPLPETANDLLKAAGAKIQSDQPDARPEGLPEISGNPEATPLPAADTKRAAILQCHADNPGWPSKLIAQHVGASEDLVRATASKFKLKLVSWWDYQRAQKVATTEALKAPPEKPVRTDKPVKAPKPARAPKAPPAESAESDADIDARLVALHGAEPELTRPQLAERLGVSKAKVNYRVHRLMLNVPHARASNDEPFVPEVIPPANPQKPVGAPTKALTTLTDKVQALHQQHPNWTARLIANELGANPNSVSALLAGIRNPKAVPAPVEKPEFTGRRQMVEHYGAIAKRLGKPS